MDFHTKNFSVFSLLAFKMQLCCYSAKKHNLSWLRNGRQLRTDSCDFQNLISTTLLLTTEVQQLLNTAQSSCYSNLDIKKQHYCTLTNIEEIEISLT